MAEAIICGDYYEGFPPPTPARVLCSRGHCIENRWVVLVYSMDLSEEVGDEELGNVYGGWSVWDLPSHRATQIDDDDGSDIVTVAIDKRIYILDYTRYRDEWAHNAYKPVYRVLAVGPIPSEPDDVKPELRTDRMKRLREFAWNMTSAPVSTLSKFRVTVREWLRDVNQRITVRAGRQHMRVRTAVKGQAFSVRIEHAADEPFTIEHWSAAWDVMKRPVSQPKRTI